MSKLEKPTAAKGFIANRRGAIYAEFLVAFFPVYICFMHLMQLSLLFSAHLIIQHAAEGAARGLALALAEQGALDDARPVVAIQDSRRAIARKFALASLGALIDGNSIAGFNLILPDPTKPGGGDAGDSEVYAYMISDSVQLVRARVEATFICVVPFANRTLCDSGVLVMAAESVFPSQRNAYQPAGCN